MKKQGIPFRAEVIAQGALTIALIFASFALFKGVTNIINAFLVPIALAIGTMGRKPREVLAVYGVLVLCCLLFFNVQFFFAMFYCCIAFLLVILHVRKVHFAMSLLVLTLVASASFFIATLLTDLLFLTHMNELVMRVLKGNWLAYAGILLFEGALVGTCQLLVFSAFYKKMRFPR
jgi:hypothetical protein